MRKRRKHFNPTEKVAILRRHLIEKVPVSDLCDQYQLQPTVFYAWQRQLFENGSAAFERKNRPDEAGHQRAIAALRDKLRRKDEVVSELMEEHVRLKKSLSARQLVRRFCGQAALSLGSGNARSGSTRSRRQASSSPLRRAASSTARASTPRGDQLIPWCLQRADTAQSLNFSTRVLAIHNPARRRCW